MFSCARRREKLTQLARDAGGNARAGTPREAAQGTEALLLAVHWPRIDGVLSQAGDLAGKVIVSCSLPLNAADTELVLGHTTSGAEALAQKVPGAEVVAAFNNIPGEVLFGVFEARGKANPPSMVYCGDAQAGKAIAATLIRDVGFDPIDAGSLKNAPYTERLAMLVAHLGYGGTEGQSFDRNKNGPVLIQDKHGASCCEQHVREMRSCRVARNRGGRTGSQLTTYVAPLRDEARTLPGPSTMKTISPSSGELAMSPSRIVAQVLSVSRGLSTNACSHRKRFRLVEDRIREAQTCRGNA